MLNLVHRHAILAIALKLFDFTVKKPMDKRLMAICKINFDNVCYGFLVEKMFYFN